MYDKWLEFLESNNSLIKKNLFTTGIVLFIIYCLFYQQIVKQVENKSFLIESSKEIFPTSEYFPLIKSLISTCRNAMKIITLFTAPNRTIVKEIFEYPLGPGLLYIPNTPKI